MNLDREMIQLKLYIIEFVFNCFIENKKDKDTY